MSLSVIVASGGRPTLPRTIQSIVPQLHLEDELIVVVDQQAPWGHSSRNRMMRHCKGEHLAFVDDDDVWTPGAGDAIRRAVDQSDPNALHLFKMRYAWGNELWTDREVRLGNVSTGMVIAPNREPLARWDEALYEGDHSFISAMAKHHPVCWWEDVILLVRPENY